MSLDVWLTAVRPTNVFDANITHNLGAMAEAAGIYKHLWRPEELGIVRAEQLIEPLERALADLKAKPEYYGRFDASNGWGKHEDLAAFVQRYLEACRLNPDAEIGISR